MQCPKCGSKSEHIKTFEQSPKTNRMWVIERCPRCNYAGWDGFPKLYDDYLEDRTQNVNDGRGFWGNDGKWYPGLRKL